MSKSLKNFITIDVSRVIMDGCVSEQSIPQDALRDYTPRQLRLAFLLQIWNARMDFKRDLISDVRTKEDTLDVSV